MSKKKVNLEKNRIATETKTSCICSTRRQAIVITIIEIAQFVLGLTYVLLLFLFPTEQSFVLARIIISAVLALSWGVYLAFDLINNSKDLILHHIIDILCWLFIYSYNCSLLTF